MRLLTKARIGSMILRNRIVMPPVATGLATPRGEVTEELVRHYERRARWLGMVIVEHSYVDPLGKLSQRQLGIYDDSLIDGLRGLAARIKGVGAHAGIQINHAGLRADPALIGGEAFGPSASKGARELSTAEIENLVEAFAEAASRAVKSGFEVVEIHGAHGFLLNQFASPLTNRREDPYGGGLEDRMRFPLEVVKAVRRVVKPPIQLWYRLGADDRLDGGNRLEEGVRIGKMLAGEGVDVLDVSGGLCGSRPEGLRGPGFFAYAAAAVKKATGLPVIAVGGIRTVAEAEEVLNRWGVDLVAVGRALLEFAEWGQRAYEAAEGVE